MGFDHIRALSELIVALSIFCASTGRPVGAFNPYPSTSQVQAPEATDVSTFNGTRAACVLVAYGADLGRVPR